MTIEFDRRAFGMAAASALAGFGCSKKKSNSTTENAAGSGGGPGSGGTGPEPKSGSNVKVVTPHAKFNCGFPPDVLGKSKVHALFISDNGSRVLTTSGGSRGKSQVWDVSAEPKRIGEQVGTAMGLSPDGARAIVMSGLSPDVVDVESGKKLGSISLIANHIFFCAPANIVGLVRSQDWSKARNLNVKLFDGRTGADTAAFVAGPDDRVDVAPPAKEGRELILAVPNSASVKVCDLVSKQIVREFQPAGAKTTTSNWSGFIASTDGKWIAFQAGGAPVGVYDTTSGAVVATLPARLGPYEAKFVPGRPVYLAPSNLARDDKGGNPIDVAAYDINKKSLVTTFRGHEASDLKVAVSANGKVMATGDEKGNVLIWNLADLA